MRGGFLFSVGLFFSLNLNSPRGLEASPQAYQLLQIFGSTCSSQGEWTRSALNQSELLSETLRQISQSPECTGVAGALRQLEVLQRRLTRIESNHTQRELYGLRKRQQEILFQISVASDPLTKEVLEASLLNNEIEISHLEGYEDFDQNELRLDDSYALDQTLMSVDILLNQALANQDCLLKTPNAIAQLAAVAGSIAGGIGSSGLSLAFSAGSELLGIVTEWARRNKLDRQMKPLSKAVQATALSCVMESLSASWCSAEDARRILETQSIARNIDDPLWKGLRILDRELPVLLQWFGSVRAGSPPANSYQSDQQIMIIRKEEFLRQLRVYGQGLINENAVLFEGAKSDEQRWNIMKRTIEALSDYAGHSFRYGTPPTTEVYSTDYAPYYLAGLSRAQAPKDEYSGGFMNFSVFDPSTHLDPGVSISYSILDLSSRLEEWIRAAEELVGLERNIAFLPDPLQILDEAVTPLMTGSRRGLSPVKALEEITHYLREQKPKSYPHPIHQEIYADSIRRLEGIVRIIDSIRFEDKAPDLLTAFREIRDLAQLEHGIVFFSTRLTRSIRIGITQLLFDPKSNFEPHLIAQLLAGEDVIAELQRISSKDHLALIRRDVELSQGIAESSIESFFNVFSENLVEMAEYYFDRAATEPSGRSTHRNSLANFCLLLTSIPQVDESSSRNRKLREICRGTQVPSMFPFHTTSSPALNDEVFARDLHERICLFRDHYRKEKIFQDYLQTSPKNQTQSAQK